MNYNKACNILEINNKNITINDAKTIPYNGIKISS